MSVISSSEPPPEPAPVARARSWLDAFDFERPVATPVAAWVRMLAWIAALFVFATVLRSTLRPITWMPARAPLNGDAYEGHRYGMPLEKRKAIFAELATVEIAERKRAIDANTWNGHLWSREDDRGHYEMVAARALAPKYGVTLTQIYMVLDEGIREKWPGPDGKPLPPTTPPQDPRTTW